LENNRNNDRYFSVSSVTSVVKDEPNGRRFFWMLDKADRMVRRVFPLRRLGATRLDIRAMDSPPTPGFGGGR